MLHVPKQSGEGSGRKGSYQPPTGSRANNVHSYIGAEGNVRDYSEEMHKRFQSYNINKGVVVHFPQPLLWLHSLGSPYPGPPTITHLLNFALVDQLANKITMSAQRKLV